VENSEVQFDMGVSTLQRINYWLYVTNEVSYQDKPLERYKSLKRVYAELYPFISNEKDKDRREVHNKFKQQIEASYSNYQKRKEFQTSRFGRASSPRGVYDLLDGWELEIRRDLHAKKLYMRMGDDAGSVMLN
jgi:hypothetical protein